MLEREPEKPPQLAAPGAGVPAYQRLAGKYLLLPIWCRIAPPQRAPAVMERQAALLVDLAGGFSEAWRVRRVLVPPQLGLEDSSRFYSWAMVVEHLTIVGNALAGVLAELTLGRVPEGEVSTAALKPQGGVESARALAEYRAMLRRFRGVVEAPEARWDAAVRYGHPWFGPLGPRAWASFGPFHQAIHLRQARRIRSIVERG
jgi:hypothetical protein